MKNTIKLFGIIALVAVIGFSMATCDDGSNGDNNGNENENGSGTNSVTINFHVATYPTSGSSFTILVQGSDSEWNTLKTITSADITLNPNDVVTLTGRTISDGSKSIDFSYTKLKAGTVYVTIKDKGNAKFVPANTGYNWFSVN
jgi:hypothetical protein